MDFRRSTGIVNFVLKYSRRPRIASRENRPFRELPAVPFVVEIIALCLPFDLLNDLAACTLEPASGRGSGCARLLRPQAEFKIVLLLPLVL